MKLITIDSLDDIALGAAVLGTGGGGDPYIGKLLARSAMLDAPPVPLLDASELADDDLVIPTAMMGAPTVMVEKIPAGSEVINAINALSDFLGRKPVATMPMEAGGVNSMIPFSVWSSRRRSRRRSYAWRSCLCNVPKRGGMSGTHVLLSAARH